MAVLEQTHTARNSGSAMKIFKLLVIIFRLTASAKRLLMRLHIIKMISNPVWIKFKKIKISKYSAACCHVSSVYILIAGSFFTFPPKH